MTLKMKSHVHQLHAKSHGPCFEETKPPTTTLN